MGKILQVGEELDGGRLEVVGQLKSSGKYAEIYRVRKTRAPLECLLKVNLPHNMLDKDSIAESVYEFSKEDHIVRTDREVKMLLMFDHPNIAQVDDVISFKERYKGILFRPISEARTLRELILNDQKNKEYEKEKYYVRAMTSIKILKNLLQALDFMNESENPIVHRDIRPENIVIDKFYQAFLIDFGLACGKNEFDGNWGSLQYAPPEVYKGKGNFYSDMWSLGLCLYEFLTCEHLIDNNPNLKDRREHIIEKVRLLNQEDIATNFSKGLLEKLHKIKNCVYGLISEKSKYFPITNHIMRLYPLLEYPYRLENEEFDNHYIRKIASFCMPFVSFRRTDRICTPSLEEFQNEIDKRAKDDRYKTDNSIVLSYLKREEMFGIKMNLDEVREIQDRLRKKFHK